MAGQLCAVLNPPQIWIAGAGGVRGWASVGQQRELTFLANAAATTWSAMPNATTEFRGVTHNRIRADISGADEMRLGVRVLVAGAPGSTLRPQYSLDGGATFTNLSTSTIKPGMAPIDTAGGDVQLSSWQYMPTSARADVLLRLVGQGGNGTASPEFGNITLSVR